MERRFSKRGVMKYGVIGAGALLVPLGARQALDHLSSGHSGHVEVRRAGVSGSGADSPAVKHFDVDLPRPPVLQPVRTDSTTDYYEVAMREARKEILPGKTTTIWGYNGQFPGPTIEARRGRRAVVKQTNNLREPMSVHYHGGVTAPEHDGYAENITVGGKTLPTLIQPGKSWEYQYPNQQPATTNWYHDHAVHDTARHVYQGLAGFYLVRDDQEAGFGLPRGEYEVPLVLQDRIFAQDGTLVYDNNNHGGVEGDVQLVNGAPWPRLAVAQRKYRFRLCNGANWRRYELGLSNGQPLILIGTDSGFLRAPVNLPSLGLFQGERADVVIDFSGVPVGSSVVLQNRSAEAEGTPMDEVLRFDVVRAASDDSRVPAALAQYEVLRETPGLRTREFRFERGNGMYQINGKIWDRRRFDADPRLGTTEIWKFVNNSGGWYHPIHVHLVEFQILDRNGQAPHPWERGPLPGDRARKDVVAVGENDTVRVIIKWDAQQYQNFTGPYMIHCHNTDHEDHDMMTQFNLLPRA